MTRLRTNDEPATTAARQEQRGPAPAESGAAPLAEGGWSPLGAWRVACLYGPLAAAVRAAAEASGDAASLVTMLVVGEEGGALARFLERGGARRTFDVRSVPSFEEGRLPFADRDVDLAVAVDWLPLVPASRRERLLAELCRVARHAVVVAGPFDAPEVAAAERGLNDAYRAAHGSDHPRLGRHLERGLPDAEAARGWLATSFPNVAAAPLDDLAAWQTAEGLAVLSLDPRLDPTPADVAASAVFPAPGLAPASAVAYRTLLVGSARPVRLEAGAAGAAGANAVVMHHAAEVAAQRRSFERLAAAVSGELERERAEFRAAVASLAAEVREREANAEFLAREIRKRDQTIADQQAAIEEIEEQLEDTAVHARNMEAQAETREREADERARAAAEQAARARDAEAALAEMRARADAAEAAYRTVLADYERLLSSRGGRALTRYVQIKRSLLGRGR